ncbi:MAG: Smr/MutS family protein, partial [Clostridiales bacterium]|nr:Smr/MutS family protein [Clostridiales bacterium]
PSEIDIERGRNPLIPKDTVVPVGIRFGTGGGRVLIITGPNTGGKTVTLKTVGLFLLMAQAGLWLPASRARLPVARRIFADIGDEQSIEQSLSTFSAHMTKLVRVVNEAEETDVVLLDELGAGTDPAEGAALAIALLDTLRTRGCPVLATTHFTELKKYAVAADGALNASMEFDVETLSPTFHLLMGSPGRSNAFEISEKLGLKPEVIARARELLDSELVAFDEVVAELESSRAELESRLREAESRLSAVGEREGQAAETLRAAEAKARDVLAAAETAAEDILREAAEDAEEITDELKELIREARARGVADGAPVFGGAGGGADADTVSGGGPGAPSAPLDAGDALRRLNAGRKKLRSKRAARGAPAKAGPQTAQAQAPASSAAASRPLAPGDFVTIPGGDRTAEVLSAPDDRGRVNLIAGGLRMTLPAKILTRADAPSAGKGRDSSDGGSRYAKIVLSKMDAASASIDLHGKNLDEAEMLVDKYLDDAALAHLHEVMICHGRGSGVLRVGIRKFLKGHHHVASFRPGYFDEGGDGVTIVTLK